MQSDKREAPIERRFRFYQHRTPNTPWPKVTGGRQNNDALGGGGFLTVRWWLCAHAQCGHEDILLYHRIIINLSYTTP